MTVPNIVTVMGSGVALALSGVLLVGGSLALGLSAAVPQIPYWASFLLMGLVVIGVGVYLILRGQAKTEQKVEKELSPAGIAKNFPVATAITVGLAGLILFRLFQGRRRVKVVEGTRTDAEPIHVRDTTPGIRSTYAPAASSSAPAAAPQYSGPREKSWLEGIAEALAPLASAAAASAGTMAIQALNLPDASRLVSEAFGLKEKLEPDDDRPDERDGDQGYPDGSPSRQHAGNSVHSGHRF